MYSNDLFGNKSDAYEPCHHPQVVNKSDIKAQHIRSTTKKEFLEPHQDPPRRSIDINLYQNGTRTVPITLTIKVQLCGPCTCSSLRSSTCYPKMSPIQNPRQPVADPILPETNLQSKISSKGTCDSPSRMNPRHPHPPVAEPLLLKTHPQTNGSSKGTRALPNTPILNQKQQKSNQNDSSTKRTQTTITIQNCPKEQLIIEQRQCPTLAPGIKLIMDKTTHSKNINDPDQNWIYGMCAMVEDVLVFKSNDRFKLIAPKSRRKQLLELAHQSD